MLDLSEPTRRSADIFRELHTSHALFISFLPRKASGARMAITSTQQMCYSDLFIHPVVIEHLRCVMHHAGDQGAETDKIDGTLALPEVTI